MAAVTTFAYVVIYFFLPVVLSGVAFPRSETEVTKTEGLESTQQPVRSGRKLSESDFPTDLDAPPPSSLFQRPKAPSLPPAVPRISSTRVKYAPEIPVTKSSGKAPRPWRTIPVRLPRRGVSTRFPAQSFVEIDNDVVVQDRFSTIVSEKRFRSQTAELGSLYNDNGLLR